MEKTDMDSQLQQCFFRFRNESIMILRNGLTNLSRGSLFGITKDLIIHSSTQLFVSVVNLNINLVFRFAVILNINLVFQLLIKE